MRHLVVLLLFSVLIPVPLAAQWEAWTGVALENEVNKNYGYLFEMEHRRTLAGDPEETYLILLASNFALAKKLSLTLGTRLRPGAAEDPSILRVFSDLNHKLPLGKSPFTLEGRLRYQQDRPLGEDGSLRRVSIRPRLGVATKINEQLSFIAEMEGRFRFDSRDEWSRVRFTTGLEYVVSDRISLELFWRQEDRINQASPSRDIILGLYADYTLPSGRERSWKARNPFGRRITW
ncbi:DUF2490 domain-containing protein [Neolewinella lacunae]|uniref:DUF2490 domain-containing protein n=1 Tax=Neolewinella lacunae TaxID=1517758 RepID=A0A923PLS4_9BACT|nr:DUF2490 domain-containing protein [Neolewinella lacunae]MBC6995061.1 DUF2490 domain-containing protein [Neolewinella lacunae]MDN3635390.1 DUF2490 domain-containing protein [Neolewinella lacunae]